MTDEPKPPLKLWAEELHRNSFAMRWRVERTLYGGDSEHQRIDIVQTAAHGRMLFNDGIAMLCERDEFVYHEMIAHVPMFLHEGVRNVLIVGGGDGGTAREVLRHPSVERCLLVEIDPLVVEGCREHIPSTASSFDDPRCEVRIADGVAFLASTEERFDLILIDSTDPIGPAAPLFGTRFYRTVRAALRPGGLVVAQAESPFLESAWQGQLMGILADAFRHRSLYNYVTMTYPGGLWSFALATDADLAPRSGLDDRRVEASGIEFRYYSPDVHRAAFALPAFQRRALGDAVTPAR